ncbi:MAG: IS200/IS605 family transposase [Pleurocapsa sp. MO_226.B13]|nr:IS200/IS605 family transposase [Pleurocapsa sp. MO_226.B13]
MKKSTDIRTGRHCVFKLHVHLVFVTKYRQKVFTDEILKTMEVIFRNVCQEFETELVEMNGEVDHVHLLLNYPPKVSISKLVNSLKGVSSRLLRKQHPELAKYYWKGGLWSPSYFAGSCGGAPLSIIKQYIEQQNRPL